MNPITVGNKPIIVGSRLRKSAKPKIEEDENGRKVKKFPIDITIKLKGQPTPNYFGIQLFLSQQAYKDSQDRFPAGKAADNNRLIKTAEERTKAIAEILDPFSMPACLYMISRIKDHNFAILTDHEFPFDVNEIAGKYLDIFKRENAGTGEVLPSLKQVSNDGNNSMIPAPLRRYTEQIHNNLVSNAQQQLVKAEKPEILPISSEYAITPEVLEAAGASVNLTINNFYLNGVSEKGQLQLPDIELNPDADLLVAMMKFRNKKNTKSTDKSYERAGDLLLRFCKEMKEIAPDDKNFYVSFRSMGEEEFEMFETFMLTKGHEKQENGVTVYSGLSPATVKTYLSFFKSTYMIAKAKGIIKYEHNPFEKGKHQLHEGPKRDVSLTSQELADITIYLADLIEKGEVRMPITKPKKNRGRKRKNGSAATELSELETLLYWMFSFLSNGITQIDVAKLTDKDMNGDGFSYVRSKTIRKKKYNKIEVAKVDMTEYIINKLGRKSRQPDDYIFPIIKDKPVPPVSIEKMTPQELLNWRKEEQEMIRVQVNNHTRKMNDRLREIAKKLGYEIKKFITYSARHTFTNEALNVLEDYIVSRMLGHSSLNTIKWYANRNKGVTERKALADHLSSLMTKKEVSKQAA